MNIQDESTAVEGPKISRTVAHLPLAQVVRSTRSAGPEGDGDACGNIKRSIHLEGLRKPIVVRPLGEVYEVVSGHRRFAAFRALAAEFPHDKRFKRIAVHIANVDEALAPIVRLADNMGSDKRCVLEIGDAIAGAIESGVSHATIGRTLGWDRRQLNRHLQIQRAPRWLRSCALEVKIPVHDADPARGTAVVRFVAMAGLSFTTMFELVTLYNVLVRRDLAELAKEPAERAPPSAEAVVREMIYRSASEQWSTPRLRDQIARVKDPTKPRSFEQEGRQVLALVRGKCVIDLERAAAMRPEELAGFARQLTKTLRVFAFKNVVIEP